MNVEQRSKYHTWISVANLIALIAVVTPMAFNAMSVSWTAVDKFARIEEQIDKLVAMDKFAVLDERVRNLVTLVEQVGRDRYYGREADAFAKSVMKEFGRFEKINDSQTKLIHAMEKRIDGMEVKYNRISNMRGVR